MWTGTCFNIVSIAPLYTKEARKDKNSNTSLCTPLPTATLNFGFFCMLEVKLPDELKMYT